MPKSLLHLLLLSSLLFSKSLPTVWGQLVSRHEPSAKSPAQDTHSPHFYYSIPVTHHRLQHVTTEMKSSVVSVVCFKVIFTALWFVLVFELVPPSGSGELSKFPSIFLLFSSVGLIKWFNFRVQMQKPWKDVVKTLHEEIMCLLFFCFIGG